MSYEFIFKYIIIGDVGVGKSCLLSRFATEGFLDPSKPTVAVEFLSQIVDLNGRLIKLQIWDTAGQEKYKSLARSYYRQVAGILLVYDISK